MKKVFITILVMIYIFVLGLLGAKVNSFDNGNGYIITDFEIFGFSLRYWSEK
jgi:uncharacterized protein YxeA